LYLSGVVVDDSIVALWNTEAVSFKMCWHHSCKWFSSLHLNQAVVLDWTPSNYPMHIQLAFVLALEEKCMYEKNLWEVIAVKGAGLSCLNIMDMAWCQLAGWCSCFCACDTAFLSKVVQEVCFPAWLWNTFTAAHACNCNYWTVPVPCNPKSECAVLAFY